MCRRHGLLAVLIVMGVNVAPALAYTPKPFNSYKKVSPDGKYLLVMISPAEGFPHGTGAEESRAIRQTYPQSGLYPNDGSITPVWTIKRWSYKDSVYLASDNIHLVLRPAWPLESPDDAVISFYASGHLVRAYSMRELIDNPLRFKNKENNRIPSNSWEESERIDNSRMEYEVTTKDGGRFVFDVRTGQIVSESRYRDWSRIPKLAWLGAAVIADIVAIVTVCWLLMRNRRPRPNPADDNPS
jgi:hypothetical protein